MTSGHRPPSSPRGFSGFCFASSKGVQKFKEFNGSNGSRIRLRSIRSIRVRIETSRGQVFIYVYRLGEDGDLMK